MLTVLAVASGHSGVVHHRYHPEWSDLALFAVAVAAIWFVRRALRRRFAPPAGPAGPDRRD